MSDELVQIHSMIIPTVLIPLTAISVVLSSIAVFIAGVFGLKLKAEGPKKLLEVLLKPRVIIGAVILNLIIWGGVRGFYYLANSSSPDFIVHLVQGQIKKASGLNYPNVEKNYYDNFTQTKLRRTPFEIEIGWKTQLPKGAFSAPVVSGDSVFVGSDDGYIYEVEFESGQIIRRFYIGTEVTPSPIVYNGFLFSGEGSHDTHHARVSKFDLKSGDYVGSYRTIGHVEGQINIQKRDGESPMLYASGGVGGLYAINPEDMSGRWISNLGHADGGARFDGDLVFYGTGREKHVVDKYRSWAIALKVSTGEVVWKREMPASSWMLPVVYGEKSCFVFGEVYFSSEVGGVACFNKKNGDSEGVFFHNAPIVSDPLILDGDLFVVDINGQGCRVNINSMKPKWCHKAEKGGSTYAGFRYEPKIDALVQITRKNGIYVLDPDSAEVLARWPVDASEKMNSYAPVAVTPKGWVFISDSGDLLRLNVEPKSKTQAQ